MIPKRAGRVFSILLHHPIVKRRQHSRCASTPMLAGSRFRVPCIVGFVGWDVLTLFLSGRGDMMCHRCGEGNHSQFKGEVEGEGEGERNRVWFPYRSAMQVNLSEGGQRESTNTRWLASPIVMIGQWLCF